MRVSVIVCTRNRRAELTRVTESLYAQTQIPDEYIVIDGSDESVKGDDDFKEKFSAINSQVELIYEFSKPGLTRQRNLGVKLATGDILFFFDDDIVLDSDFLQEMKKIFQCKSEYMGGMGNIIESANRSIKSRSKRFYNMIFCLENDRTKGKFKASGMANKPHGNPRFVKTEFLSGGLTGYRKEIFSEFEFDETVSGYSYFEDADFSRRVSQKYSLFYNPKARCRHLQAEGGRGDLRENRKKFLLNYRYFFFKNFYRENRLYIVAHWWSIVGIFLKEIAQLPVKYNVSIEKIRGYLQGLKGFSEKRAFFGIK